MKTFLRESKSIADLYDGGLGKKLRGAWRNYSSQSCSCGHEKEIGKPYQNL